MRIITYTLKAGQNNSDQFYTDLSTFTDTVIHTGEDSIGHLVTAFNARHPGEYTRPWLIFDLLILGILWRIYAPDAVAQSPTRQRILTTLAALRQNHRWTRPLVDPLRGTLSRDLITPGNQQNLPLTLPDIEKLAELLESTGDFKEEVRRIRLWQAF